MRKNSSIKIADGYCKSKKVALGDLYLFKYNPERKIDLYHPTLTEITRSPSILCDLKMQNVHMLPNDVELAELCSNIVFDKYNKIREFIEKKIEIVNNDKIDLKRKTTSPGNITVLNGTKYEKAKYLFSYLGVKCKNTSENGIDQRLTESHYDLVFNRFFVDGSNTLVNCILLCFQIKTYCISNYCKEPKSKENYPQTSSDGEGNSIYYNFEVDIHLSEEEIANRFINFVLDRELR
jgi:hypothetical protein